MEDEDEGSGRLKEMVVLGLGRWPPVPPDRDKFPLSPKKLPIDPASAPAVEVEVAPKVEVEADVEPPPLNVLLRGISRLRPRRVLPSGESTLDAKVEGRSGDSTAACGFHLIPLLPSAPPPIPTDPAPLTPPSE